MAKRNVKRSANPVDVVEAAYELDRSDEDWLANIVEIVRPLLDRGRGVVGYTFDLSAGGKNWHGDPALSGMPREEADAYLAIAQAGVKHGATAPMHVDPESLGTMRETAARLGVADIMANLARMPRFRRLALGDVIALRTIEPGGKGIVIAAPSPTEASVDRRSKRLWARVAAHLAAGRRLRATITNAETDVDAVLTPSGKLDDARGDATSRSARELLRDAVMRTERARGTARRSEPERATEAWTGLVAGRWSLVDRFESGGRRFIVARKNPHVLADPRALHERERAVAHLAALGKSNKLIAYELGLSASTVATHLTSAMRKLRASSRVDLVRLLAAIEPP